MNFQPECCIGFTYSIHFQPLVAELLQIFNEIFLYFFMFSATWLVDFQMALLFHMSLSSFCLFSIRQLRELLAKFQP